MIYMEKRVADLKPYENNPRKNKEAVKYVANSIKEFGFKVPIVVDTNNVIICGHTRWLAAKKIGMKNVPVLVANDLNDEQIKAFRLADNKVSEFSEWDDELLKEELCGIEAFNMEDFGFLPDTGIEEEKPEKGKKGGYSITIQCTDLSEVKTLAKILQTEFNYNKTRIFRKFSELKR